MEKTSAKPTTSTAQSVAQQQPPAPQKEEDKEQTVAPVGGAGEAPVDPFAGMSLEEKQKNMKEGLEQLINQMEPRVQT
jgi:hypothetical protein